MTRGELTIRINQILANPGSPHWDKAKEISDRLRAEARDEAHRFRVWMAENPNMNSSVAVQNPQTQEAETMLRETVNEWQERTGRKPMVYKMGITGRPKAKHTDKI